MREKIAFTVTAVLFVAICCTAFVYLREQREESFVEVSEITTATVAISEAAQSVGSDADNLPVDDAVNTLVNINTAGADELMTLKGIGKVTAQKIIDYRAENGAFLRIEELMEVNGIGEAKFAAIKDYITIG